MGNFLVDGLRENPVLDEKLKTGINDHIEKISAQRTFLLGNIAEMSTPHTHIQVANSTHDSRQTVDTSPEKPKPKKKYVRPLPSFMTIRQMHQLLKYFEPWQDRHMLVSLLWVTGLRINEALSLTPSDCDFEKCQLRAKWQKSRMARERIVSVLPKVMAVLYDYSAPVAVDERIFPFTRKWAHKFIAEGQKKCGFKLRRYGPHSIRHAFATHLKQEGRALEDIMYALGHADLRPTQIYAHVDGSEHRKAVTGVEF